MIKRRLAVVLSILLLLVMVSSLAPAQVSLARPEGNEFVKRAAGELRLHGEPFRFVGANNYYLMYKSKFMVDDVLETAAAQGFRVMRVWGSLDIGNEDGSNSVHGKADGVYFQYWDGAAPAYNDGEDGLEHLDYVVYKAGEVGIKLVIPFVNNWQDFGGMDQYVRWRGGTYHDDFYTDPIIREWYKAWISHLLNRTNIYTGLKYKDDPTIMTWELANEPRCKGSGTYPMSPDCTPETLVAWADDVSHYIKQIDGKHLISVGDEGFYCIPDARDWTENCGEGVDTLAFTRLEKIDVMSFHLYPDHWGKSVAWSTEWIRRHITDAQALNKPVMLGEFGLQDKSIRNPVYKTWTDTVLQEGGNGALYWILSGEQDNGTLYPDYDGFTVYCPSPVCTTLSNFGAMMKVGHPLLYPPVADHDMVVTEFEMPTTLIPLANDIAYDDAVLLPETLDLDPEATGRQTTMSVYGGTYEVQAGGNVVFTPDAGFSGDAQISYTIDDTLGQRSNPAHLKVTVKPSPTGALMLFSFETGIEGWGPASWEPTAGTVEQTTAFATDGTHGLQINSDDGGWFGVTFGTPIDLTGKSAVKVDLQTLGAGTSSNIALQFGDTWNWCQGSAWPWFSADTTATLEVDLLALGCDMPDPDLTKLQAIYVYFNGGGTYYMDAVRSE